MWIIYSLLAALFMGIAPVFSKKVLKKEHAMEFGALQGVFRVGLLLLLVPFVNLKFSWQIYAMLYFISLVYCVAQLFYLKSVRHSELSSSIPLMNISPLFLLLIAWFFLGEVPGLVAIIGVLLLVVGTYVLQISSGDKSFLDPFRSFFRSRFSLYMLFALFLWSLSATMDKAILNTGLNFLSYMVIVHIFIGLNFLVLELFKHGFAELKDAFVHDWRNAFFSVFFSLVMLVFQFAALTQPGALVSLVIPLKRSSTLVSTLLAGKLFHEHRIGIKLLASAIMILGVILIAL